jgi:hypothetical protein
MNNKLNLNQKPEARVGMTSYTGCLEYLIAIGDNLEKRPEFRKRNDPMTEERISHFRANVTEVKLNYTQLVSEFEKNDTEITFQITLGCIQVLYKNMCDLLSYLPVGVFIGSQFTQGYEQYLIDKTELFAKEIETLKNIEHIKNRTMKGTYKPISYEPIKIGNNIALYEFWKKHKDEKVINITDITPFLTCKNWRLNMIKTKKKIIFIDYFKEDDACKPPAEKANAHKTAKIEQIELQNKLQTAEDREAAADAHKSKRQTGTRI